MLSIAVLPGVSTDRQRISAQETEHEIPQQQPQPCEDESNLNNNTAEADSLPVTSGPTTGSGSSSDHVVMSVKVCYSLLLTISACTERASNRLRCLPGGLVMLAGEGMRFLSLGCPVRGTYSSLEYSSPRLLPQSEAESEQEPHNDSGDEDIEQGQGGGAQCGSGSGVSEVCRLCVVFANAYVAE